MFDVLKQIIVDKLGIEPELIHPESFLEKDLELDSTETVVIAMEIKKRLGISYEFPEKDLSIQELSTQLKKISGK